MSSYMPKESASSILVQLSPGRKFLRKRVQNITPLLNTAATNVALLVKKLYSVVSRPPARMQTSSAWQSTVTNTRPIAFILHSTSSSQRVEVPRMDTCAAQKILSGMSEPYTCVCYQPTFFFGCLNRMFHAEGTFPRRCSESKAESLVRTRLSDVHKHLCCSQPQRSRLLK